ncbi:3-hydroxyacyl-CoA dehydrogenase NAD-binding domain-containing protein, partial [Streptomyces flaveolus]|uniref:3-hydroxyacyl-CoA dehydrogenase NAD-binding domain-containing protein n=1 Tax=Streptomyces flaveolus TaxID=67297 RepID=UPI0033DD03B0
VDALPLGAGGSGTPTAGRTGSSGNAAGIRSVGVAGCGLMGSGIAELCARSGLDTLVYDVNLSAVEAGRRRIETSLVRAVTRGKLTDTEQDTALAALTYTTDLADFADRDLAVEAVP